MDGASGTTRRAVNSLLCQQQGLLDDTSLALRHEGDEMFDFRDIWELGAHMLHSLTDVEIGSVEEAVGFLERAAGLGTVAVAVEPDLIDAADAGGIAVGDHVGWDILHDL